MNTACGPRVPPASPSLRAACSEAGPSGGREEGTLDREGRLQMLSPELTPGPKAASGHKQHFGTHSVLDFMQDGVSVLKTKTTTQTLWKPKLKTSKAPSVCPGPRARRAERDCPLPHPAPTRGILPQGNRRSWKPPGFWNGCAQHIFPKPSAAPPARDPTGRVARWSPRWNCWGSSCLAPTPRGRPKGAACLLTCGADPGAASCHSAS